MNRDYHSKSKHPPIILLRSDAEEPEAVTKVGIIPFLRHADSSRWRYMLMKPHAEHGHPASAPEFQIAKGTRRINLGDGWCDMRDDDLKNADPVFYENLVDTALREGEEEIGLKRRNILTLYDAGVFSITSARRNLRKAIHVFAAEIKDEANFGSFEAKTAEVVWMTATEYATQGRADHIRILDAVAGSLVCNIHK